MRNRFSAVAASLCRTSARAGFVFMSACGLLLMPMMAMAQTPDAVNNAQQVAQAAGVGTQADLLQIIGRIINVFLGSLGVIFLVLMLYAGYMYMTAAGDADKVKKATALIRNAIIGLVIIMSAWAITAYILGFFANDDGGFGGIGGTKSGSGGILSGASGSLGNGIIESVLPQPNSKDVPRNTPVFVTFKEPIFPGSFIQDWTDATSGTVNGLNSDTVKIYRTDCGNPTTCALGTDKARVFVTSDHKTFVIKPVDYLGSPTTNISYKIDLKGGGAGIQKDIIGANGAHLPAFIGAFSGGYSWQFEVSTVLDLIPPVVTATIPSNVGGDNPRNVVIQLNFNKAMDPTTVTGKTQNFRMIEVLAGSIGNPPTTPISGEFKISNQYRTVEFLSDAPCGSGLKNSCGVDVFCLPPSASLQVTAHAAPIDVNAPPQGILTNNGYAGVVSAAGNSLDGNTLNGDGKAEGPPVDDFSWNFTTNDKIKISPPQIVGTVPDADPFVGANSNVALDQPVEVKFDTLLQSSTVNSDTAKIDAHGKDETSLDTFWYEAGIKLVNQDGSDFDPNAPIQTVPTRASIVLRHRIYQPSGTGAANLNLYDPYVLSGVQDAYQNCFNPAAKCGAGLTNAANPNCCKNQPSATGCKTILSKP